MSGRPTSIYKLHFHTRNCDNDANCKCDDDDRAMNEAIERNSHERSIAEQAPESIPAPAQCKDDKVPRELVHL